MEIWQWLKLILLWVTVAGYALLALSIFVHAFFRGRKRERSAGLVDWKRVRLRLSATCPSQTQLGQHMTAMELELNVPAS
jgi:hypothetical protein